ncbi:MAG TPA: isoprenylcysteine carboxylmethyltransferase family protein [Actinomycetota bacterium]|nr:isoprenylcysteine carboxylmethyltransferase family protein [Actinomycetota bacterium]
MERRIRTGWLLVAAQFLLLAVLVFAPRGDAWTVPGVLRAFGLLLRVGGLAAIVAGAVSLGRSLAVHPAPSSNAELKTDGLYRHVRHPIYSGVLLLGAGIALTSGNGVCLVAMLGLIPVLTAKSRLEEQLLRERFAGYDEYARRTPAFVPRPPALFL